jgi:predicted SnoaL-like aldol condensation-catalyzing enzyme
MRRLPGQADVDGRRRRARHHDRGGRVVIDVCRVVDGRIVEYWGVPDRFAALAQTGVLDRLAA